MKRSMFSEEQVAFALRQAESGTPVVLEIVREVNGRHAARVELALDPVSVKDLRLQKQVSEGLVRETRQPKHLP